MDAFPVVLLHRLADFLAHPRRAHGLQFQQDDGEFLAAVAGHHVGLPAVLAQDVGQRFQRFVADGVG